MQAIATTAAVVDTTAAASPTPTPPQGYSRNGVKLGRPKKVKGSDSLSADAAYASHGGARPSRVGEPRQSSAARAQMRLTRSRERPRAESEPPALVPIAAEELEPVILKKGAKKGAHLASVHDRVPQGRERKCSRARRRAAALAAQPRHERPARAPGGGGDGGGRLCGNGLSTLCMFL